MLIIMLNSDARHLSEETASASVDYSRETKLAKHPALRVLWLCLGCLFVGLGFVGALLPLLPTTVFMIMAAFFFARSSPRFYNLLLNNPLFGQLVRDWRDGLGMPLRAKVIAVTLLVLTIGSSTFFIPGLLGKLTLITVGLGICTYLLTRPTKRSP